MHYRRTSLLRLSFVALLLLFIQLSLSISPVLSQDITIGRQTWTNKNLDVSTFRNGELIPQAKSKEEWLKAGDNKTAVFCYYEYDSKNGKVYGKLYNWYAVNDSRGLAPKGYHIPSDAEWTILTDFLGGSKISGKKMKSKDGWSDDGNGDNSSGFNGLPGGSCNYFGYFDGMADYGNWWSSSENDAGGAWERYLSNGDTRVYRSLGFKDYGFSVCCLRD
jgi:uncharacterized protein (TIGR02145 family)